MMPGPNSGDVFVNSTLTPVLSLTLELLLLGIHLPIFRVLLLSCFEAIPGSGQELLLALYSDITTGMLGNPHGMLEIELCQPCARQILHLLCYRSSPLIFKFITGFTSIFTWAFLCFLQLVVSLILGSRQAQFRDLGIPHLLISIHPVLITTFKYRFFFPHF